MEPAVALSGNLLQGRFRSNLEEVLKVAVIRRIVRATSLTDKTELSDDLAITDEVEVRKVGGCFTFTFQDVVFGYHTYTGSNLKISFFIQIYNLNGLRLHQIPFVVTQHMEKTVSDGFKHDEDISCANMKVSVSVEKTSFEISGETIEVNVTVDPYGKVGSLYGGIIVRLCRIEILDGLVLSDTVLDSYFLDTDVMEDVTGECFKFELCKYSVCPTQAGTVQYCLRFGFTRMRNFGSVSIPLDKQCDNLHESSDSDQLGENFDDVSCFSEEATAGTAGATIAGSYEDTYESSDSDQLGENFDDVSCFSEDAIAYTAGTAGATIAGSYEDTYDEDTYDEDSGAGDKDSGAGDKDSGAGDKDSGAGDKDSGAGDKDSGAGDKDSGAGDKHFVEWFSEDVIFY